MEKITENTIWQKIHKNSHTYTAAMARQSSTPGLIMGRGILYIDNGCFMRNGKVHEVILPPECTIIGRQAFEGCQFQKEVKFPETLRMIGDRAFAENHRLRRVHFPKLMSRIGKDCYKECNHLITAEFDRRSPMRVIPEGLFDSCVRLEQVTLPERVEIIRQRAFYRCKELKDLEFPKALREIERESFYFCSLEELRLPKTLERIGDSAFFRCKMLREVKIPENVNYIGRWAFHGCSRLEVLEILHDPDYIGEWITNKSCTIRCCPGGKVDQYCEEYGLKREYVQINRTMTEEAHEGTTGE